MNITGKSGIVLLLLACVAGVLGGCAAQARAHKDADAATDRQFDTFGRSVRQNIVAQIADPDPSWKNNPEPNTDGKRISERQSVYTTPSSKSNGSNGGIGAN